MYIKQHGEYTYVCKGVEGYSNTVIILVDKNIK